SGDDRARRRRQASRRRARGGRRAAAGYAALGARLDGGAARARRRARADRGGARAAPPARDRRHGGDGRDRALHPRRLGRPAGSGPLPRPVRRHAAVRGYAPGRRARRRRRRGRRRRRHARSRRGHRRHRARLARATARAARLRPLPRHRLATLPNAAAATGLTTLTALASSDLLVAKLSFAGGRAGDYAAASVGARVLLLIPIAVTTVLFPRVATLRDPGRERRHLLAGLGAVALASAAATALLWTLAKPLIDLTFGAKYDDAAPWLGPLSVAMALYALATVYLYHFLSLGRSRFAIWLVAVLAAQLALFAALHGSPSQLIGVQLGVSAATLAAAEAWHARRHR